MPPPYGKWYNSTTYPGYIWKGLPRAPLPAPRPHHHAAAASGDTSSDEIVGHMFVLPIVHDLVAKTDEERAMARDLMCSNVDYIVDNGFTLVDADGNVTTWGHWCSSFVLLHASQPPLPTLCIREPEDVNMNYYNYDSRGLNSLQILSWLQAARRLCDPSPSSKCVCCVCSRRLQCSCVSCFVSRRVTMLQRFAGM